MAAVKQAVANVYADIEGDIAMMATPDSGHQRTDAFDFRSVKVHDDIAYVARHLIRRRRTMGKVFVDVGMSLDGFIAGPNGRPGNPLGDGGMRIREARTSFDSSSRPAWLTR